MPGWRRAVRCGRPGISPEPIKGRHRDAAASPGQEIIVLHGISKRFGDNLVLDISLGIAAGAVVVPLSAIWAGKQARKLRWQPIHRRFE